MIKDDMLDAFSDEEIHKIKALADKVLKFRDDERKATAMEQARATLAAVGLRSRISRGEKSNRRRVRQYKGGCLYRHPADKTLVWNAKGQAEMAA